MQKQRGNSDSAEFDVAIIGAGAAGLAAAQTLASAKKRVAIIEARDRIGGRIHTIRDSAVAIPIELGAEFIHGRPDELIQIVRAANLLAYDAEGDHWHLENGRLHKLDDVWDQIEQVMSHLPGRGRGDRTFAQFIQQCCNKASQKRIREMAIAFESRQAVRARCAIITLPLGVSEQGQTNEALCALCRRYRKRTSPRIGWRWAALSRSSFSLLRPFGRFFAGEATDDQGFGGTVDSAVSTGRRAAAEALNSLGAMNR